MANRAKKKLPVTGTVSSMTGFARVGGQDDRYGWTWEIKCVNGRGLDVRCRLPSGFDTVEPETRSRISRRFSRGSFSVNLQIAQVAGQTPVSVNTDLLDRLIEVARAYEGAPGVLPPRLDGLLSVRGVIETVERPDDADLVSKRELLILESLDQAIGILEQARRSEGTRLREIVFGHVDDLEGLVRQAEGVASVQPEAIRTRLRGQLAEILDPSSAISEDRLAQEVALLLVKADIREEIDRLRAHASAARELFREGGAIGRRLDFLSQEFNREANTLCSKATDIELTRIGLEMKACIDRLREQVQNIE
jgi:uncharacterized protein (TIGR00255 family)